ncbi:MAG: 50S ribosomal protein L4 [Clostridia bacterium]|nr:50S ribosomal protein L4 [Clostridia bacterium]
MSKVKVLNLAGEKVGEIKLSDAVFGAEVNEAVLHQVVKTYLANQRQGTQSALTRAEVSGGGAKPWRQKGTGRARQGSIRAPQWIHGGVVFAPKPRDYRISLNKKVKKVAMVSALSAKAAAGEIVVVDNFDLDEIKTKTVATALKAIGAADKALVVTNGVNKNLVVSIRNMEKAAASNTDVLNVYEVLNCKTLVMTKDAVEKLAEVYA